MSRKVAIVGRPNVGKSTLFNRLTGQWTAIVDDQSGVTRDRIYGEAEWEGKPFSLIDTGGFMPKPGAIFEAEIREQVEQALGEASLVLFMVDVRTGITAEDEAFSQILLRLNKPVILVTNKADNTAYSYDSYEFYRLGFSKIFPLSSTNGSGTGDLLDEIYQLLNLDQVKEVEPQSDDLPRFAIIGRPNTGKSTMVNALLGTKQNIVSEKPGTTRDAITSHFNKFNREFEIVDTAGVRKEKRIAKKTLEQISINRAIKAIDKAHVCFLVLDAHLGLENQDTSLIDLVRKRKKGLVILINKWDDVEKDDKTHLDYLDHIKNRLNLPLDIPVHFVSALKKTRLMKAMEEGLTVYQNLKQEFSTSLLNRVMLKAINQNPPPAVKGQFVQIKYVTQFKSHGQTFAFFCNNPEGIKTPYKKFLERTLREHFNLKGVPISLLFKQK